MQQNAPQLWQRHLPRPQSADNKYNRGHALVVGGYPLTGAARLAARAAARIGAGLTTVAVPEIAFPIYAASLTSIMVRPFTELGDLQRLLDDTRVTGLLIGPGAGVTPQTHALTLAMLDARKPTVLDADALTIFAENPFALDTAIAGPCVLTPHEGEFSRLFDNADDRATRASNAAKRCGAVIVLKGHETIIAAPDGQTIVNRHAPPNLATAGSGDVLSGMILGLLTQGMEPFLAAAAAVWMHGQAAHCFGPGLIADDIPEQIPGILKLLS